LPDSLQIAAGHAAQWSDPAFVLGGWVPFTVNADPTPVSAGATITVDWSAAGRHSGKDWIGLYAAGAPDANFLAQQNAGASTTGHLTFTAPMLAGQYEFRYFQTDGTRAAASNRITVR